MSKARMVAASVLESRWALGYFSRSATLSQIEMPTAASAQPTGSG